MTVEQICELYKSGLIEFAGHGDMHKNELKDIKAGREKLLQWLNLSEDFKIGFASPGSGMTPDFIRENKTILEDMGFSYARTGPEIRTKRLVRTYARKSARIFHYSKLYKIAYKESLQRHVENNLVLSIPVLRDTTLAEMKELVRYAERKKLLCTFMFHSILKDIDKEHGDIWCYDYSKFYQFISWLKIEEKNNRLDILTTADALRETKILE